MGRAKDISSLTSASEMRFLAEERFEKKIGLPPLRTEGEMQGIVHELEVHQIELEMQNTELRQARDEVEKTLEKYTDLFDFAPVGYFNLDRNGDICAVNITGASLLKVERSRLLGRRFAMFVAAESRLIFNEFLDTVFTSQVKESFEVTLTREGNSTLTAQLEAVTFQTGQECRVAVIDITERRVAENALDGKRRELEELNSSLEVRIFQAVDELRKKDQIMILQDRMAVMGEMINNIAHQWRQPLNTLGLVIQQVPLYHEMGDLNSEFLEENTRKSMELIQHMSTTINDFRNFFRSDKEMVTFGINQVIVRTLSLIEQSFQDQKINIAFDTVGNPSANGYPNEYAQVLLNILMNARDALVGNNTANALISIRAAEEGNTSVVTITDNGGGIPNEIIGRLFDPYFTTKGPDKGTGIGLYMSKTIIEKNMGGRLTVSNTELGADFRIEV